MYDMFSFVDSSYVVGSERKSICKGSEMGVTKWANRTEFVCDTATTLHVYRIHLYHCSLVRRLNFQKCE